MYFTVPVYQRKHGAWIEWITLGLGPHTRARRDRHAFKVQEALTGELREAISKLPSAELETFQLTRGTQLERVRLELVLRGAGGKRKVSGLCPLVLEPRWASEGQRLVVAYHPKKQPDWFPVRGDSSLAEQAVVFFQKAWADLDDHALAEMWTNAKDLIKVVSFSATPRSILDDAPNRERGVWDDLKDTRRAPQIKSAGPKVLHELGTDLTRRASEGLLEAGTPRAPYREHLRMTLCGSPKQPAVLVGPAGAGKTTIIHRAIYDLLAADDFDTHNNLDRAHAVWRIAGKRIIAGMSYLGDWEQRCIDLLDDTKRARAVLFVEDVHLWGRIGRTRDSDRNLAEFFRGPVARGELVIIGECTATQLQQLEEDAPAFAQALRRLHVAPAGANETFRMLLTEMRALEPKHHVTIEPLALRAVLELGASLLPNVELPGKALDLLRQIARSSAGTAEQPRRIDARAVMATLREKTGMPEHLLVREPLAQRDVEEALARRVMGQPAALRAAVDLVFRIKTGLTDPRRPYAVYLFAGPTGTGKTELAKAIAELLYGSESRLVRLDMSELSGPDATARLIGDRWNPEGLLTQRLREQPHCVVLLDEIEKAHPEVHNLLLQLFDEGRLTDAAGGTASFTHAVVLMTSNLGARARAPLGFGEEEGAAAAREHVRAVREFFPPELFNRIDRVIPFAPITESVAREIAVKELSKLLSRRGLSDRNVFVTAHPSVVDRVVRDAFDPKDGARSVKRWLEDHIGTRLTEHLVGGGSRAPMQLVRIEESARGTEVHADSLSEAEPIAATFALEPLMKLPLPDLMERAKETLQFLDRVAEGPELAALSDEIREHLRRHSLGDRASADAIYNLESMRAELHDFRSRLERMVDGDLGVERRYRLFDRRGGETAAPPPVRASVLSAIAEAHFLERALGRVRETDRHAAIVDLLHVGDARSGTPALLEWLALAYAGARGGCEDVAVRGARGAIQCGRGEAALRAMVAERPVHVAMKVVGLSVRDFFELEAGCHIHSSLSALPNVVRVRVLPAPPETTAASILESQERSALPPAVRRIQFDPPRAGAQPATLELEDYAMGTAMAFLVRDVEAALAQLWMIRMSRRDVVGAGAVSAPSLRVYFAAHAPDRVTGILMRAKDRPFDRPLSAIGASEQDVLRQLEATLLALEATRADTIQRYLWEEAFQTADVRVDVHPETYVDKRVVIGERRIPLQLTYVYARLPRGGYRVLLPRFGWWFVLEELSLAAEVLRSAVAAALVGESARSIYDFRREGDEYVREWSPRILQRRVEEKEEAEEDKHETLDAVAEELVEKAARGRVGTIVGDAPEMAEQLPAFEREPPPSVLIVGGPGVGKTIWVRRLARHFAARRGDRLHPPPRIWSTSADRVLAGMIYVGMWQKRCLELVRELAHSGDILYFERLVPILEAQPDGASIADILLPAMLSGEISVMAECTDAELERCMRRAPSFVSAMELVRIEEPPQSEMPRLLDLYQTKKGGASLHPAALKRLVVHLAALQKDARFPGKGFRFLDWLDQERSDKKVLYPNDVSEAYARWSGLPLELVSDDKAGGPKELAAILRRGVIGQDDACDACARVLARLKANMNDPERPCGTLLFVGPTGVGKTELAKQLARFMFGGEERTVRLDMSEYMFPGSARRLLESGGGVSSLAERVRAQPLSLVLLDEIEKAHSEVFDLLLGILGEGRLTDSFGRLIDFRMTLIVMTSNLGVTETRPVGFAATESASPYERAVRDHFRPELVGRIDRIVAFRPLSQADVLEIVDLEMAKTQRRTGLLRRDLRIELHPDARLRLADLGWHPTRGARPLKRVMEERVVAPVAALLARDPALRGKKLLVVPAGAAISTDASVVIVPLG